MRKTIALLTVIAMLLSSVILMTISAACGTISKHSLQSIRLTETERSWSNPEEQYAGLLDTYGGQKCYGAMVVATDKDVVYLYAEDETEKDGTTLVSQDTVFDIASTSKVFTAVCILQLAEQGKLSLDDTLDKYFPHYVKGRKITIYNLLHMTSGISDYLNNPDPFWKISGAEAADQKISDILQDRTTDEELLKAMYSAPLEFEPGSQVSYSNTNYRLLAFIIEQLTGMRYCDYVKENIFDKCGMTKTTSMALGDMTYVPVNYEELAEYGFTDEKGYTMCPNNSRGDGGIHSCLTDMVAFDRALFGGKLLSEKSMDILLNDNGMGYCCGLRKDKNGYSHDGSAPTCAADNRIIESEQFGHIYVISLTHDIEVDTSNTGAEVMAGTGYTKGVFEDGVYVNDYAGIKIANIPADFYPQPESDMLSDRMKTIMSISDERQKTRELATVWDIVLMGSRDLIWIDFLNTKAGVPDDPDYTEDDFLDDYRAEMMRDTPDMENNGIYMGNERVKVTLGGKEYTRDLVSYADNGACMYYYARNIDDDLMCIIGLAINSGDKAPEEYEALFLNDEAASAAA